MVAAITAPMSMTRISLVSSALHLLLDEKPDLCGLASRQGEHEASLNLVALPVIRAHGHRFAVFLKAS